MQRFNVELQYGALVWSFNVKLQCKSSVWSFNVDLQFRASIESFLPPILTSPNDKNISSLFPCRQWQRPRQRMELLQRHVSKNVPTPEPHSPQYRQRSHSTYGRRIYATSLSHLPLDCGTPSVQYAGSPSIRYRYRCHNLQPRHTHAHRP